MQIKINTIITLENNDLYVVLSETMYQGIKFYLMMGLDEKREVVSSDVAIFEEEKEGEDLYLKKVTEPNLMLTLTKLLKNQM